jgi:predicted DNA-binding transcriptional regulator AlpA
MKKGNKARKRFLSDKEVAMLCAVSLAAVRKWRLNQKGPKFIRICGSVKYRRTDLDQWLNACPTGGEGSLSEGA